MTLKIIKIRALILISALLTGLISLSSCSSIASKDNKKIDLLPNYVSQDLALIGYTDKTTPHKSKLGLFLAAELARRDFNLKEACSKYIEIIKIQNNRPQQIVAQSAFPVLLACGNVNKAIMLTKINNNKDIHPLSQALTFAEAIVENNSQIINDKNFINNYFQEPYSENVFLNFYVFYWALEKFRKDKMKINKPQTDIYNFNKGTFNNGVIKKLKNLNARKRNNIIITNKLQSGLIHAYNKNYEQALNDWGGLYKLRDSYLISREITSELAQVIYLMAHAYSLNGENEKAQAIIHSYLYKDPILNRTLKKLEEGDSLPDIFDNPTDNLAKTLLFLYSLRKNYDQINSLAVLSIANYVSGGTMRDTYNFEKSKILFLQNRLQEALEFINELPLNSDIYLESANIKAEIIFKLGDIDKATSLLISLDQQGEKDRNFLLYAADMLRRGEKYQDSIELYDELINRIDGEPTGEDWLYFYNRGIAYERSGNWTAAERDMIKAIELNPEEPSVLNYVAYIWVDRGIHIQKGKAMIEKALAIDSDNPAIIDSLGWAYYKLKDYDKAVEYLEKAVQYLPLDPVINDHLGDSYWKVGRTNEAFFQWHRALQMSPDQQHSSQLLIKSVNGLND